MQKAIMKNKLKINLTKLKDFIIDIQQILETIKNYHHCKYLLTIANNIKFLIILIINNQINKENLKFLQNL